ncbi:unnamed protein product [Ceutorhynchus assimilis]|uniref:OTU domain-containing protein n=1 Tax=Ceutorhynchus assimilis TaxID=467358 RepID=A0A9N9MC20_9CUCU|nr:unnamed protein product [Ceutorhynchus assimilis]
MRSLGEKPLRQGAPGATAAGDSMRKGGGRALNRRASADKILTAEHIPVPVHFKTGEVIGDRSCLFRSVSLLLYGHQDNHQRIRQDVLSYMEQNWPELNSFALINEQKLKNFENYYNLMKETSTYGISLEILCLSEVFILKFRVYHIHRTEELEQVHPELGERVTEQRFINPNRTILKNKQLAQLELEQMKKQVAEEIFAMETIPAKIEDPEIETTLKSEATTTTPITEKPKFIDQHVDPIMEIDEIEMEVQQKIIKWKGSNPINRPGLPRLRINQYTDNTIKALLHWGVESESTMRGLNEYSTKTPNLSTDLNYPDKNEMKEYWTNIWANCQQHQEDAYWIDQEVERAAYVQHMQPVRLTARGRSQGSGPTPTVTLVGAWKCCLPWCGAQDAKAPSNRTQISPSTTTESPVDAEPHHSVLESSSSDLVPHVSAVQRSPQAGTLTDILEEDSEVLLEEEEDEDEESAPLQPLTTRLTFQKKKNAPSPNLSVKPSSGPRKYQITRSTISSTTSSETPGGGPQVTPQNQSKMQAEQGTIGDLQKYHNRYLRNRRHTLANVRDIQKMRQKTMASEKCMYLRNFVICLITTTDKTVRIL